jgi:hypothetical protein
MDGTQGFYALADLGDGKQTSLSEVTMKLRTLSVLIIPLSLAVAGCFDTRQVKSSTAYGITDTAPQVSDKGYVEFYAHTPGAVVPIYGIDARGRSHNLGAVGLKRGDVYSEARYEGLASERLRVAVPPGNNTFAIERNGPRVVVPVSAGQVTPVEVFYNRLERGDRMDIYQAEAEVLAQTTATEFPPKK